MLSSIVNNRYSKATPAVVILWLILAITIAQTGYIHLTVEPDRRLPINEYILSGPPNAPVLLTPTNGSRIETKRPTFTWTESVGAINYIVQLDRFVNFSSSHIMLIEGIVSPN